MKKQGGNTAVVLGNQLTKLGNIRNNCTLTCLNKAIVVPYCPVDGSAFSLISIAATPSMGFIGRRKGPMEMEGGILKTRGDEMKGWVG